MSWCSVPNISTLAGVLYQIYQHELVYCTEYFNTSWCTVPKILTLANVLYRIYQHKTAVLYRIYQHELVYCIYGSQGSLQHKYSSQHPPRQPKNNTLQKSPQYQF